MGRETCVPPPEGFAQCGLLWSAAASPSCLQHLLTASQTPWQSGAPPLRGGARVDTPVHMCLACLHVHVYTHVCIYILLPLQPVGCLLGRQQQVPGQEPLSPLLSLPPQNGKKAGTGHTTKAKRRVCCSGGDWLRSSGPAAGVGRKECSGRALRSGHAVTPLRHPSPYGCCPFPPLPGSQASAMCQSLVCTHRGHCN